MKNSIWYFVLIIAGLVVQSCSEEQDIVNGPVTQDSSSFLSASIDGNDFHTEGTLAYDKEFDNIVNIYGTSNFNRDFTIYIELPGDCRFHHF